MNRKASRNPGVSAAGLRDKIAASMYAGSALACPKTTREAVKWYRKAAEQEHASAQFGPGRRVRRGQGSAERAFFGQAAKWLRMAAEQGDARAQFNLGLVYFLGRGVPEDDLGGSEVVPQERPGPGPVPG